MNPYFKTIRLLWYKQNGTTLRSLFDSMFESMLTWNFTFAFCQTSIQLKIARFVLSIKFLKFINKVNTYSFQFSLMYEQKLDRGGDYMKLLGGEIDHMKFVYDG